MTILRRQTRMWIKLFSIFVKLTGWPAAFLCFRTKIYYENKDIQGRRIRGSAILISNHTSVYDFAVYLFVFFTRTLRVQMAEILFQRKLLGLFLRAMGGIMVNRGAHDFGSVAASEELLRQGGVVGIFPEGRLPRKGEARPLPFLPGAAYLALSTGAKVIPVYTDGSYFRRKRARVIIGTPMDVEAIGPELPQKERLARLTEEMRSKILELGRQLNETSK